MPPAPRSFAARPAPARTILLALLVFALGRFARADVLVLKDGRRIEGEILARTATEVRIKTSFAELTFPADQVVEIVEGKTHEQLYRERLAACATADDFCALGDWCEEQHLRHHAKEAYERAIALDPDHERARAALGFVRYGDEWMTPDERDRRRAADHEAEMRAEGLVPWKDRWVTPAEKEKLEQGLVLVDGRWMSEADAKRAQGLEPFDGTWYPRAEARARKDVAEAAQAAGGELRLFVGPEAVVAGTLGADQLAELSKGCDAGRAWFDRAWGVEPGLRLYGDRLCELYVFDDDDSYVRTVDVLAARCSFLPTGWADAVRAGYGFTWTDPLPLSSVRRMRRDTEDVLGQTFHHFGHLMVNRLGYRGRLLPPWYEEGVAALTELRIHGKNDVFCRASFSEADGTSSDLGGVSLDEAAFRDGTWRAALAQALQQGKVEPFDHLARREFSQLGLVDIATSMAILEWLESRGDGVLGRFHRELRKSAPPAPLRVIEQGRARVDAYDAAFEAAVGESTQEADATWRTWFPSR